MHGHGEQQLLHGPAPHVTQASGIGSRHPLEELEGVTVRAAVLVDRHVRGNLAYGSGELCLGLVALALEQFEVAGRALERREPARPPAPPLSPPAPASGRNGRGRADEPSEKEGAKPTAVARLRPWPDLTIPTMLVCTLGDLTLDVVVRLSGPVAVGGDTAAEIRVGAGGQAANVAAWASTLGASARFIGKTGSDDAGALARARLAEQGVDVEGPVTGRNGTICSLVSPEGERSMASDRGARPSFTQTSSIPHGSAAATTSTCRATRSCSSRCGAQRCGLPSSRGPKGRRSASTSRRGAGFATAESMSFVMPCRLGPDVVFANEDEERVFGREIIDAHWILKRGARGCSFDGDEREALPVEQVVDSTGAGDALAAGWIVGGPDLALEAAARCVQQLGAMPVASGA